MIKINKTAVKADQDEVRDAVHVAFLGWTEEESKRNFPKSLLMHINKFLKEFMNLTKDAVSYVIYADEDKCNEMGYDTKKMQKKTDFEINFVDGDDFDDIFNGINTINQKKHIYDSRRREESYVGKDALLIKADAGMSVLVVPEYK